MANLKIPVAQGTRDLKEVKPLHFNCNGSRNHREKIYTGKYATRTDTLELGKKGASCIIVVLSNLSILVALMREQESLFRKSIADVYLQGGLANFSGNQQIQT